MNIFIFHIYMYIYIYRFYYYYHMKTLIIGQIQKVKVVNSVNIINIKWYSLSKKKKCEKLYKMLFLFNSVKLHFTIFIRI